MQILDAYIGYRRELVTKKKKEAKENNSYYS